MTKEQKKQLLKERNTPPHLSILEEIGNAISHGAGAAAALIGMILLLLKADSNAKIAAALIFGGSMFLLMLMSCLYHAFKSDSKVKRLWRRFDYTSIYFLINGTFAPICLVFANSSLALLLFAIQWSGVFFLGDMYQHNQQLLCMILMGGVVYTLGMIPFSKNHKGAHFLWHLFVLSGALLHWIGIYFFLY